MIETLRDLLAPYATTRSALLAAVAGFALYRTRSHFAGGRLSPSDAKKDLSGKIYIVTGGCGGIGLETVRQLALQGGHVIAAARDYPKSHEYLEKMKRGLPKEAAERIEFGAIDLADLDSVRKFAEKFIGSGRSLGETFRAIITCSTHSSLFY